jgi:hypothetical protein
MDHANCIKIKAARQFSHILVDVMKTEKGTELSKILKKQTIRKRKWWRFSIQ